MAELNFKKGEWTLMGKSNAIVQCGNYIVADCTADLGALSKDCVQANAYLISAAPDMYEALKQYQYYNHIHNDMEAILSDLAIKALKKAEGKE
jgi:hypothetical protein